MFRRLAAIRLRFSFQPRHLSAECRPISYLYSRGHQPATTPRHALMTVVRACLVLATTIRDLLKGMKTSHRPHAWWQRNASTVFMSGSSR
jgi:hypothetical protein